jgi:NOL1/NOP2/sun family putative RNA methylase
MAKTNPKRPKYKYEMKPLMRSRLQELMPDPQDFANFEQIIHTSPQHWIRCNTLKITTSELKNRLEEKWLITQPFKEHPEIFIVQSKENGDRLLPGEVGKSFEHTMGYFYIQEISSMLPPLALEPKPGELVLDLTASPGSKTTQMAAMMENKGTILANDVKQGRINILSANLERCGVTNTILSKQDAIALCHKLAKTNLRADKILLDAPCSGEGTLRSSPKTFLMWNEKIIQKFGKVQQVLLNAALKILKPEGTLVYSTCTHAPEENEAVINQALNNFPIKIEKIELPLTCRSGITNWRGGSAPQSAKQIAEPTAKEFSDKEQVFDQQLTNTCRIYPQDNDSEGFFVAKIKFK